MDRLIWIVVPAGHDDGTGALRANVAVMPRLSSATLAAAGMASWPPPELASATFWIDIAEDADQAPDFTLRATLRPIAEATLWARYFPPDTPIRPDNGVAAEARLLVHSAGEDGAAAEEIFRRAAAAPMGIDGERHAAIANAVAVALASNPLSVPAPPPPPARTMDVPTRETLDFHDRVGLLREHPTVQKALGLILALEIPAPPTDLPARGLVRVRCEGLSAGIPAIVSPWTAYELSAARFMARSTEAVDAGMVPIGDAVIGERRAAGAGTWRVLTVDVDAAVGAMRDLADRAAADGAREAPRLPALRTGGIALSRSDMAAAMNARHARLRVARADAADGEAEPGLDAEQLLLGFRLDVQRDGDVWRSLSVREASYLVNGVPLAAGQVIEEGHIKAGAAFDHGDGILRTDDIVARWTGWSHGLRRPGFVRNEFDTAAPDEEMRLGWDFKAVEGAQPRLRFGGRYRLRLRAADITGGGLDLNDPLAERHVTGMIAFGRYEPIPSPQIFAADETPPAPGEGETQIVLRSDRGLTPAQFAAANPTYPAQAGRVLQPPSGSIGMAEQHRMLDGMAPKESWGIVAPVLTGVDPASRLALPDAAASGVAAFASELPGPSLMAWPKWPEIVTKQIIAQAPRDPLEPVLGWRGNNLVVALPPAGTVEVELSSTLRPGFEAHMAARLDLNPAAAAAARDGRHPLVTPAISVQVTHAVRKPLRDPDASLTAVRDPGATAATLLPTIDLFGVDAESTSKLELSADWTEFDDAITTEVKGRSIRDIVIDRGDRAFADPITHEFGDTRHRRVRYTPRAVSRFRHCFYEFEPDEWFVATPTNVTTTSILSSAVPPILRSPAAASALRWSSAEDTAAGTITRVRDGLIRVAMERPWFASGEGEMVAVIVAADVPVPNLHDLVSEVGADPIWQAGAPPRWLKPDRLTDAAGAAVQLLLPGLSDPVLAIPYPVSFDAIRDRWVCDIGFRDFGDTIYAPLVRLALARYQPESLDGCLVSGVTRTDFVAALPSRSLSIRIADGRVEALLAGVGPAGPRANIVEVVLEAGSDAGITAAAPSLLSGVEGIPGWHAIAAVTTTLGSAGSIPLPAARGSLRVRVTEFEDLILSPAANAADPMVRRAVFADAVLLP